MVTTAVRAAAIVFRFVELFLLLGREQRTDLRHRAVHHGSGFLHRFAANAFNLRRRLVDNRLDFRLLLRRQI